MDTHTPHTETDHSGADFAGADSTGSPLSGIDPIMIASHRRSGTHLMLDLIRRHFPSSRVRLKPFESTHNLYVNVDRLKHDHHAPLSRDAFIGQIRRCPAMCVKSHAPPGFPELDDRDIVESLVNGRVVHVVRDGRSVLSSWRHYESERVDAAREGMGVFLRSPAFGFPDRPTSWVEHTRAWMAVPGVLRLSFEDVVRDTRAVLERIGSYLGQPPTRKEPLLPPRLGGRAKRFAARLRGVTESTTLPGPATGRVPKWHEALTSRADRAFIEDRAGDLLRELGYTSDASWVDEAPDP